MPQGGFTEAGWGFLGSIYREAIVFTWWCSLSGWWCWNRLLEQTARDYIGIVLKVSEQKLGGQRGRHLFSMPGQRRGDMACFEVNEYVHLDEGRVLL